ncbi:MAG: FtsQ-type POTRA domain-containing protein [Candidatus Omnitrophica bacterium]|nr:FtsQ-type POTRA domain-containing protein [Candidatus Omnitrophota bacterium]
MISKKFFVFIIFSSFLLADPIPQVPQIEKEKTQPKIKGIVSPQIEIKNGRTVLVKKINVKGNTKVSNKEIEKITKEYEGKEITISDLKIIADKITEVYWNKGYVTSFAYVPAQKVVDGVIEIKIIEGKIGKIEVSGNKYYTDKFIERHFQNIKKEEIVNNKSIERDLLILNEYPKLNAYANLKKGELEGTTDIVVDVEEKYFPFNLVVFANNFGSRYTTRARYGLTFDLGNLTKNGDILSLTGLTNIFDFDDMRYYKFGYTLPINGYGTKFGISFSNMSYEVDKEINPLGVEGEATIWSIYTSHPLIKARTENLTLFSSLNFKNMKNYLFEKLYTTSRDKYTTLEIGIDRDRLISNQHIYWTGKATFGLGELFGGMDDNEYTNSSRPGLADGTWIKLNLDVSDVFNFRKLQLITRLSGQYSSDNLVSGEQMVLGGADSVRAYPTGDFLGDYGYFLSAELRTPFLPNDSFLNKYVNWAFFIDHGGVYKHTPLPGEDKSNSATGIGAGFRVYIPCHFHLRFDAARRLGGDKTSDGDDWRYWVQALLNF